MSKKKQIEILIGILLLITEIIVIVWFKLSHYDTFYSMVNEIYLIAVFTNVDVIFGVVILLINSKKD